MKKYEIPFNFDIKLIDFLDENIDKNWIDFLYLSPFIEDSKNARSHTEGANKLWGTYDVPKKRDDYTAYIKEIINRGYNPAVLFQREPVDLKTLDFYLKLGVNTFIVNSDEMAKTIKRVDKGYTVIASITKILSLKDIYEKDLSMYDRIVLYFPFNRALSSLKKLPRCYKYILLLNSFCIYNCCEAKNHWRSSREDAEKINCRKEIEKDKIIYIPPEYTSIFEPYVHSFKLQGREYPTRIIGDEIYSYYKKIKSPYASVVYNRLSPFNMHEYFDAAKDMDFVNYSPDGFRNEPRPA